jgi:hypothetical protein
MEFGRDCQMARTVLSVQYELEKGRETQESHVRENPRVTEKLKVALKSSHCFGMRGKG